MAYKNTGGVYANMQFPTYEYREYPKHIQVGPHGQYEQVNSKEEEDKVLGHLQQVNQPDYDPEKEALIAEAVELGVPINRKWTASKLRTVISDFKSRVDDLPPEELNPGDQHISPNLLQVIEEPEESKEDLLLKAKALGIPARKEWSIDRLKTRIAEAEAKVKIDE